MTTTLYRPVNQEELDLIEQSGWTRFPPRLFHQPIFYPVMNEQYATELTQWNVPHYGAGFVLKFEVKTDYLKKFEVQIVGAERHGELWVPAEELEEFNDNIVGQIGITKSFFRSEPKDKD